MNHSPYFRPMRIGIIADVLDTQYAGIYYYAYHFIEALTASDPDNEYFLLRMAGGKEGVKAQEIIVPTRSIPAYEVYRKFVALPAAATKLKLDVVIEPAHFGPFNLPKGIKRVTIIHDLTPMIHGSWHPWYSGLGHRLLMKGIADRADMILTNSLATKQDIIERLAQDTDKVVIVYPGHDPLFRPVYDPGILHDYGIYKDYLLFQGTLEPRKNLVTLIEAYERYREGCDTKMQLILAGKKGWKIDKLIKRREASVYKDDIILLGYVAREDMPALYSHASVFVYPSYYEGFGLPLLEAMACGTTCIASSSSSLPEVGSHHVDYFDPYSSEDLANTIPKALAKDVNPASQIKYAQSFTWQHSIDQLIASLSKWDSS